MCGIVGVLNLGGAEPVDPELIQKMMDMIAHRGPDGEGKYLFGSVGLGHRRLSIIDLKTGAQPMCNEDGTIWIVYNGEVYNFLELRSALQARGHSFKSTTDTEVIIHLYEDHGAEAVEWLRGMFAFALWDERKQCLLLARDRVGIKPLYYTNTGKSLLFASEMKSLLADSSVARDINLRAIDRFLTYYYLPGNETLLQGVYKLEPGHYLTACNGLITVRKYWDLNFKQSQHLMNFDEAVRELQELLHRTIKSHMISDVPVGVLLSGGVDSTGVLRHAVEQTDKTIHTFTVGFAGAEFADERPYAKLAAKHYRTIHQDITLTSKDFRDLLPKYVWHMEEPVCEPPAIALYLVSHLARKSSVKVLLSGEGGDEAFGGYQKYRNLLLLEAVKSAFGRSKGLLQCGLRTAKLAGWEKIGRYGDLIYPSLDDYYLSITATPNTGFNSKKEALYKEDFARLLGDVPSLRETQRLFKRVDDYPILNRMLYIDTKTWLPDDLLVKADKMTMAASTELRVPLLDHQVLEFASSLPPEFKVKLWTTKRLLKAALRESTPNVILKRKKTGFPIPYEGWLNADLKELVFDVLLAHKSAISEYFKESTVRKFVELQRLGKGYSKEVFSLLVLELWHQQFLSVQPHQTYSS